MQDAKRQELLAQAPPADTYTGQAGTDLAKGLLRGWGRIYSSGGWFNTYPASSIKGTENLTPNGSRGSWDYSGPTYGAQPTNAEWAAMDAVRQAQQDHTNRLAFQAKLDRARKTGDYSFFAAQSDLFFADLLTPTEFSAWVQKRHEIHAANETIGRQVLKGVDQVSEFKGKVLDIAAKPVGKVNESLFGKKFADKYLNPIETQVASALIPGIGQIAGGALSLLGNELTNLAMAPIVGEYAARAGELATQGGADLSSLAPSVPQYIQGGAHAALGQDAADRKAGLLQVARTGAADAAKVATAGIAGAGLDSLGTFAADLGAAQAGRTAQFGIDAAGGQRSAGDAAAFGVQSALGAVSAALGAAGDSIASAVKTVVGAVTPIAAAEARRAAA